MDPITQGALGAALPLSFSKRSKLKLTALLGCFAGMAPDIDIFIRSANDPLLFLEFHRQFTHSLVFIPIGALICALIAYRWTKKEMAFKASYLICLLGYSTHALLDACTSYGTMLAWPFSYIRIAWNNISVMDPMMTIPLLLLVIFTVKLRKPTLARIGMFWVFGYLSLGVFQNTRTEAFGLDIANARGHYPDSVSAKPGLGSLLLWKVIYEWEGRYYVDGVRSGWALTSYEGSSIEKLDLSKDLTWLKPGSQQAKDLKRFDWFSHGFLAIDVEDPHLIIDMRYSVLPNEIKAMWGIRFDTEAGPDQHVEYLTFRDLSSDRRDRLWTMLIGVH
ncbi:MAG: metal-dependent hydrolase [Pseudomonadales bacterium]|nr:metal-dependent hydrolase [Pseudomonadales bacterium]